MQYIGIIDMAGLDSFALTNPTEDLLRIWSGGECSDSVSQLLFPMQMRMRYNGHRHPVLFVAEFEDDSLGLEVAKMLEARVISWSTTNVALLMRGCTSWGIARTCRGDWEILKKLVPEYRGELSGDTFPLKTLETIGV